VCAPAIRNVVASLKPEVCLEVRKAIFVLSILAALVPSQPGMAADKVRDWQTGRLLDSERNRYFAGTVGSATTGIQYPNLPTTTNTSQNASYRVYETFVIEGDQYVYQAQERLHWKWSKPANLTVNGPVKYTVEKQKLFVLDEDGKQHEMEIVKKILRPDAAK